MSSCLCKFMIKNMWKFSSSKTFALLVLINLPAWCGGLRDVRVVIPPAVRKGDKAVFHCLYDIEADALYAVKWYKGDREFFRFTPKDRPTTRVFPLQGLDVVEEESNATALALWNVTHGASGRYKCEVSADAPSFHTALVSSSMDVVELPIQRPVINGIRSRYRINDLLKGNCTSVYSLPAANLTWFINGHQAKHNYVRRYHPIEYDNGLRTAVSSVQFLVTSRHFLTGKLKVRCTAHIYRVYSQSTEKSASEEKKRLPAPSPETQHVALVYPVQKEPEQSRDNNMFYSNAIAIGAESSGVGGSLYKTKILAPLAIFLVKNILYYNLR